VRALLRIVRSWRSTELLAAGVPQGRAQLWALERVVSCFSWLRRHEVVAENPFQKVQLIRLEQQIIRPIELEEVRTMLAALDDSLRLGARDTALTLFLLDTGVRASEATGLDLVDLDLEHGRARVLNGKGKKQRVVAIGGAVRCAIERYLLFRGTAPGPLFQSRAGGRMASKRLILLYDRLSQRAGVSHVHPHRFRHTFATMAIRSAAREIDVQHLLGHSTSAMVRRYTCTYDAEQAAIAHSTFSPAAQLSSTVVRPAV